MLDCVLTLALLLTLIFDCVLAYHLINHQHMNPYTVGVNPF